MKLQALLLITDRTAVLQDYRRQRDHRHMDGDDPENVFYEKDTAMVPYDSQHRHRLLLQGAEFELPYKRETQRTDTYRSAGRAECLVGEEAD
jgi:hypothetical protein